jgi:hypothetical protein
MTASQTTVERGVDETVTFQADTPVFARVRPAGDDGVRVWLRAIEGGTLGEWQTGQSSADDGAIDDVQVIDDRTIEVWIHVDPQQRGDDLVLNVHVAVGSCHDSDIRSSVELTAR